MEAIASALERWNAFAPLFPVSLDAHSVAVVLPFAVAAILLLGVFACARRARAAVPLVPWTAPSARADAPRARIAAPGSLVLLRASRPRGPTGPRLVATA
ncbi:MAG: hypothetical protein AB7H92_15175 [Microbacteriaceae bacterium]